MEQASRQKRLRLISDLGSGSSAAFPEDLHATTTTRSRSAADQEQLGTSLIERIWRGIQLAAAGATSISNLNGGFRYLAMGHHRTRRFDRGSRL